MGPAKYRLAAQTKSRCRCTSINVAASPMSDAVNALVLAWAKAQPHIHALALCGSYARGEQRPDSDIDFLVLSATPARFKTDQWLAQLNFEQHGLAVVSTRDAQYGVVWSRHVELSNRLDIEFCFAPLCWASTGPIEPGTRAVISNGFIPLHDPELSLRNLQQAANRG
jgi:hypothetical protein